MKTDLVLTMDEYLDQYCVIPKRLSPPARDARHISITTEEQVDSSVEVHSCRCDQWGLPCPGGLKSRPASEQESAILAERK
jgi:hypothetical protein